MPYKDVEVQRNWVRERNRKQQAAIRDFVRSYKLGKACLDCGGDFHFSAMDFDHRENNKSFSLARVGPTSVARVMEEIDKCDLVCANCHRVRTYNRGSVV